MKRVRLVRVIVQPELVSDEDGVLTPLDVKSVQITARDWKDFCDGGLEKMIAASEQGLNQVAAAPSEAPPPPPTPTAPFVKHGPGKRTKRKGS